MTKQKKINLKKSHLILLIAIIMGLGISKFLQYRWNDAVVELKDQQLHVLVAKNRYQQHKGLGGRESLDHYDGMLFLFPGEQNRPGIVMRDMHFPIDIVWLQQGIVIDIAKSVQPQPNTEETRLTPYYPRTYANMVLELRSGWIEEHDLNIGDYMSVVDE